MVIATKATAFGLKSETWKILYRWKASANHEEQGMNAAAKTFSRTTLLGPLFCKTV